MSIVLSQGVVTRYAEVTPGGRDDGGGAGGVGDGGGVGGAGGEFCASAFLTRVEASTRKSVRVSIPAVEEREERGTRR